jgi:threonine dehydratase
MDLNLERVYQARRNLAGIVLPTPLTLSDGLSDASGARVYLKWENLQKTGSFKVRGAVNKMLTMDRGRLAKGVITASAGNHAQGVAFGAELLGVPATAVMPLSTPRVKIDRTERLGAKVILFGENYDEAHDHCIRMAADNGMTYIPAFEDIDVMAGHGTIALDLMEEVPDVDVILVPVGGGGLISGIAVAAKTIRPKIKLIGIQSTKACTMFHCFRAGEMVPVPVVPTLVEGLAGGIEEITLDIVRQYVDDMVLADEEQLTTAIWWVLAHERQVVEASGVVGVSAVLDGKIPGLENRKVVVVISGGNIDQSLLRRVVSP